METCLVCEKATYVRLLECCQLQSEARHRICQECVRKLDYCPLCRNPKRLTAKDIIRKADNWEMDKWIWVNLIYSYYRFKMVQFLTDRITPLEYAQFLESIDPYENMDDLPYDTQINNIDLPSSPTFDYSSE